MPKEQKFFEDSLRFKELKSLKWYAESRMINEVKKAWIKLHTKNKLKK